MMPLNTFHPLPYKQLINIANATNYLPDVVGQIRMFQGSNMKNPRATTAVIIGLLLNRPTYLYSHISYRSRMARLTLMDNASALFRDLHRMSVMKYKVVLITSINPRVCKGNNNQ
ncbi:hypothetical protein YC2023_057612 [Brassica napus]